MIDLSLVLDLVGMEEVPLFLDTQREREERGEEERREELFKVELEMKKFKG